MVAFATTFLLGLTTLTAGIQAKKDLPGRSRVPSPPSERGFVYPEQVLAKRQLPADVKNQTTLKTPNGHTIRYKENKLCETSPGTRSISGYVDLADDMHTWFQFFTARNNPETAPITMWTNGGPGSDSSIGLYQELGPCNISENLEPMLNPYSWTEFSHFIFLSQPTGVGFSYAEKAGGTLGPITGEFVNSSVAGVDGRYPYDKTGHYTLTTQQAAYAAYEAIQTLIGVLPEIDNSVQSKEFNIATESYGGRYGPVFYSTFNEENEKIREGKRQGTELRMSTLTIINGIIDEATQAPYYPEFAVNNTYGIKAYNDTVYSYAKFSNSMVNGCEDQVALCRETNRTTAGELALCTEAANLCRDAVEGVYYSYGGRGVYDIRHPYDDITGPQDYFADWLNLPATQAALGTDVNYTTANSDIYWAFQQTGDFVYDDGKKDLEMLLSNGVRVSLIYGDADYICNWFGGQAVSLNLNYTHSEQFRQAGYAPMTVDGVQYGESREYGNFSFTRIYEAGHEVPYYQPVAALALFQRTIQGLAIYDGSKLNATSSSTGPADTTHTTTAPPLPSSTMMSSSVSASAPVNTTVPEALNRYNQKRWDW